MEEMWQTHSPPIPLRYDTLNESPDTTIATTSQNMAVNEQRIWSINECFHRFINRYYTIAIAIISSNIE
jgi:hypothetical protein